jgi:hypothetical protein
MNLIDQQGRFIYKECSSETLSKGSSLFITYAVLKLRTWGAATPFPHCLQRVTHTLRTKFTGVITSNDENEGDLFLKFVVTDRQCFMITFFIFWRCDPTRLTASSFLRFPDHTQRRTTVGRTPLDEWSVRRRDLYLTTHNTHNRQTSMPPVEFEPTISAGERSQTYALDCAATGTGLS